ncbi:MAG TPA: hypothetical protein VMT99_01395 [Candidatus Paceibacterota bacterium]|nr:hypothetical protein [Candidatus Paceibacterota bacterium]
MPVAERKDIAVRTFLDCVQKVFPEAARGTRYDLKIVCGGKCNAPIAITKVRVLICGEFRCLDCFAAIVRSQPSAFGLARDQKHVVDEDVMKLLVPYDGIPGSTNLYEPRVTPRFVAMISRYD